MLRSCSYVVTACAVLLAASVASACNGVCQQAVVAQQVYAAPVAVQQLVAPQVQVATYSLPFVQQQAVVAYQQPVVAAVVAQPIVKQRIVQRQRLRVFAPRQRSVVVQRVRVGY